jgi:cyclopropane fatty-acyl-phospholipid synthase-like methyltransferase
MAQPNTLQIQSIITHRHAEYQDKVIYTYDDPAEMWHKALGDNLSFQFGLFDEAELTRGPQPGPVGPSEFRHFDCQLELAGFFEADRSPLKRIFDLGCGWGYISRRIAGHFLECPRIDAVNISQRQLD